MKRRTRYVLVLVLAVFLVNLPLVHSGWTDRKVEQEYRDTSRELFLEEWMQRNRASAVLDNVARLTAAVQ